MNYQCQYCPQSFSKGGNLNRHMRTFHPNEQNDGENRLPNEIQINNLQNPVIADNRVDQPVEQIPPAPANTVMFNTGTHGIVETNAGLRNTLDSRSEINIPEQKKTVNRFDKYVSIPDVVYEHNVVQNLVKIPKGEIKVGSLTNSMVAIVDSFADEESISKCCLNLVLNDLEAMWNTNSILAELEERKEVVLKDYQLKEEEISKLAHIIRNKNMRDLTHEIKSSEDVLDKSFEELSNLGTILHYKTMIVDLQNMKKAMVNRLKAEDILIDVLRVIIQIKRNGGDPKRDIKIGPHLTFKANTKIRFIDVVKQNWFIIVVILLAIPLSVACNMLLNMYF